MSKDYSKLFEPFKIGNVEIKNRFAVGPMGMNFHQNFANPEDPTYGGYPDDAIAYFEERAKGGFGLIVTGVQLTDPGVVDQALQMTMFLNTENYIKQGLKMNAAVNKYGSKMFLEIGLGVGRNYPGFKAPSAGLEAYKYPEAKSEEYTIEEIQTKVGLMVNAAKIAQAAGFAGIDLHTLHWGYLMDEFVLGITNKRTDKYGGDVRGRMTIVKEIVEGIQKECGPDFPITVGLGVKSFIKGLNKASIDGSDEAGRTVEESIEIAKYLEEMGVAAIFTDVGVYDSFYYACPPSYVEKGHGLPYYKPVKEAVNIPVLVRSRMGDADLCAEAMDMGFDGVMLARPSLADPEFPNKVAAGTPEKIRPCIGCNLGCIAKCVETFEHECCAVNPRSCYEYQYPPKKAEAPKKIAIVGGGPGGMQAALTAVECGHTAEIFEKRDVLGGELISAGAHEFKGDILRFMNWQIREIKEAGVPVHFNTEFTVDMFKEGGFDVVIMATGAAPVMPKSIKGIEKAISGVELLENEPEIGDTVIVAGGGMVGCETAVDLAKKGKKVYIVEMLPGVLNAEFVPQQEVMWLKDMIEYTGITVCAGQKLVEVTDDGVVLESVVEEGTGETTVLKADKVIMALGLRPVANLTEELKAAGAEVITVGSANKNGNVINATHDAFQAVYGF